MGNDEIKYAVWLQCCFGAGFAHTDTLFSEHSPKEWYLLSLENGFCSERLGKKNAEKMKSVPLQKAEEICRTCESRGISMVAYGEEGYPKPLSVLENAPIVLYYKGTLPDFENTPTLAMVGPRKISEFGKKAAYSLSYRLAKSGFIIVSGGALGGDTHAHAGALKAGGVTVMVIACGIGANYLAQNEPLRQAVAETGCLITEYPPDMPASRFSFPVRNRIVAGLSMGTVVVEAAEKSGALITAGWSNELGREVFVIPGNPKAEEYKGSNALLRDGAKAVLEVSDIFNEFLPRFPHKINVEKAYETPIIASSKPEKTEPDEKIFKKSTETLSKRSEMVYNCINKQKFYPEDVLLPDCPSGEILSSLGELEMEGFIRALPGGMYELCN